MQIGIDNPDPLIHQQTFLWDIGTQIVLTFVFEAIRCDQRGIGTRFGILVTNAVIADGRDVG